MKTALANWKRWLTVVVAAWGLPSRAEAGDAVCSTAYERAQEERAAGRLTSSLEELKACLTPACAEFMRADCSRWMNEVEAAIPSVVFLARRDGRELSQVRVTCDGHPLAEALNGTALTVDPGLHAFTFQAQGAGESVTIEIAIREGEKNRLLEIQLPPLPLPSQAAPVSSPAPAPFRAPGAVPAGAAFTSSRPVLPYVTAGVAVAGLVGFAALALIGRGQEHDLAEGCAPSCTTDDLAPLRLKYALADASLGVALIAAGVSTYLFVTRARARPAPADGTTGEDAGARPAALGPRLLLPGSGSGFGVGAVF